MLAMIRVLPAVRVQAASVMARKRVHRIAISNPDKQNRLEGMITGSSIIRALRENLPVLGTLGSTPVGTLFPSGRDRVLTAPAATTTARECLEQLLQHGVLGMPLVNADGCVVANISLSDVRKLAGLSAEEADAVLDHPVLNLVKDDSGHCRAPVTVKAADTLATVIELMVTTKVPQQPLIALWLWLWLCLCLSLCLCLCCAVLCCAVLCCLFVR